MGEHASRRSAVAPCSRVARPAGVRRARRRLPRARARDRPRPARSSSCCSSTCSSPSGHARHRPHARRHRRCSARWSRCSRSPSTAPTAIDVRRRATSSTTSRSCSRRCSCSRATSSCCCRPTTSPRATTGRASTTSCSLSSLLGMIVMASARDLITIFVALELLSIPAYMLAGWRKRDLKSNEAGAEVLPDGRVRLGRDALRHVAAVRRRPASTVLTDIGGVASAPATARRRS